MIVIQLEMLNSRVNPVASNAFLCTRSINNYVQQMTSLVMQRKNRQTWSFTIHPSTRVCMYKNSTLSSIYIYYKLLTWKCIWNKEILPNIYNIYHNNRTKTSGGWGNLTCYKTTIPSRELFIQNDIEALTVELRLPQPYFLYVLYVQYPHIGITADYSSIQFSHWLSSF